MLQPMAFLVVNKDQVRLLPVNNNAGMERLINLVPELIDQFTDVYTGRKDNSRQVDLTY